MAPAIAVRIEGRIAIVTLQDGKNQIDFTFIENMNRALDEVVSNTNVQAMVTTGTGKNFSQGLKLDWLTKQDSATTVRFWEKYNDMVCRILTLPMPTVAAINGHAYAGGAFVAMAHDYMVMNNKRGWLCFNEVYLPLRLPHFLLEFLRFKLPPGITQTEMLSMGRRYTGLEAFESGIVQRVCSPELLVTEAKAVVTERLQNGEIPRSGIQEMKTDLYWPLICQKKMGRPLDRTQAKL